MVIESPRAFSDAVRTYQFESVALEYGDLRAAARSLAASGLLLVGEPHGVRETPAVLYALLVALDIRALGLEWSHDELDDLVKVSLARGSFDFTEYWSLPASAEFFAGDGTITAGHFALLERLLAENRLDQLILYDRLDPDLETDWELRDRDMATRLLSESDPAKTLLVLTGAFHAQTTARPDRDPMGCHLARARTGLQAAMLDYAGGRCWSNGTTHDLSRPMPPADIAFRLPRGTPAAVPGRGRTEHRHDA